MKHLHAFSWLVIAVSLFFVAWAAQNLAISLLCLIVVVILSLIRGGSRTIAFQVAMLIGLGLLIVRLLLSLVSPAAETTSMLLFYVPQLPIDLLLSRTGVSAGIDLGGAYTNGKLAIVLGQGLVSWLWFAACGLCWQASPAGQWCDLASSLFGRGGQLFTPLLCLGEAISETHAKAGKLSFAGVIQANQRLAASWRRFNNVSTPNAFRAGLAAFVLLVISVAVLLLSYLGGLELIIDNDYSISITTRMLIGALLVIWVVLRMLFNNRSLRFSWTDGLAILAAIVVVVLALIPELTGDINTFETPPGVFPQLPLVLTTGLVVATAAWGLLDYSTKPVKP